MKDAIYRNQQLQEILLSKSRFDKDQPNTLQASAYYSGTLGPWTIDANFDYYSTREKTINCYSFNATKSKYRGQGAGQEMMKRL